MGSTLTKEKPVSDDITENPPPYYTLSHDMDTNPLNYINLATDRFIERTKAGLANDKIYYMCVSEWYNNWTVDSGYVANNISTYITAVLNGKFTKILRELGFVTSSNVYCDHNYLRGQAQYDDVIVFCKPELLYDGDIDLFIKTKFRESGDFWRRESGFEGIGMTYLGYSLKIGPF